MEGVPELELQIRSVLHLLYDQASGCGLQPGGGADPWQRQALQRRKVLEQRAADERFSLSLPKAKTF